MGGRVSRAEKRRRESHRHSLIRAVERFVINVYSTGPRLESMRLLLASEMASKSFSQFVISEDAEDMYLLYVTASLLRSDKMTNYALSSSTEALIKDYILDDARKQVVVDIALVNQCTEVVDFDKDSPNYIPAIKKLLADVSEEALFLLTRDHFQRFITSKYYKTWRAAEASHAIAHTEEEHKEVIASVRIKPGHGQSNKYVDKTTKPGTSVPLVIDITNPRKENAKNSKSISDEVKRKRKEELSFSAFTNVDAHELGKVLGAESWLAALISAVEGLPICFSLATARRDRRGFPLMYVNKYFEKVTGYSRKDVIGKSCKFLQCPFSEKESIQTLSDALRSGISSYAVITNATYDGSIYKNLVAVKPIFNEARQYCYVMAVHVDVSKEVDMYASKIKLVQELMEMLPDTLLNDDEDDPSCCPRS
jgi:PAS domain S-box-containing protein